MIAMQYRFVLPADYDMAIIRERIASKGPLLDDLPGLVFKAYLHAEQPEHAYAPFYLWRDAEAMHSFLNGPAFAGVARAFGWPSVQTWTPWHASVGDKARQARYATHAAETIAPYSALAELREQQEGYARSALERGALAVVIGFEPVSWSLVRLCLWREPPAMSAGERLYHVGHMSVPVQELPD
jgi:heme-degrading monooxygenase HmoA